MGGRSVFGAGNDLAELRKLGAEQRTYLWNILQEMQKQTALLTEISERQQRLAELEPGFAEEPRDAVRPEVFPRPWGGFFAAALALDHPAAARGGDWDAKWERFVTARDAVMLVEGRTDG